MASKTFGAVFNTACFLTGMVARKSWILMVVPTGCDVGDDLRVHELRPLPGESGFPEKLSVLIKGERRSYRFPIHSRQHINGATESRHA